MDWKYPPEKLIEELGNAGFDAAIFDNDIEAIKQNGDENHQIFINPEGRFRYQFSILTGSSESKLLIEGKHFKLDSESRNIYNITGQVDLESLINFLEQVPGSIKKTFTLIKGGV